MFEMFKLGRWIGIAIIAIVFVLGMLLHNLLGNLGMGDFGPLVYLIPLVLGVALLFRWLMNR